MITLFPFQAEAAANIADRYRTFIADPERPRQRGYGPLPFYQSLHAITGAGKTAIMAEAIAQMRTASNIEPIVLWISKAKVVVEQTLAGLTDGGKYAHLIDSFSALSLRDVTHRHISEAADGLILLSTAATFNAKEQDRNKSDRRVFRVQKDVGPPSIWDSLIQRMTTTGERRPLIIFYDEGHNLSDQQVSILLELKPDALILASATPRRPARLDEIITLLTHNHYTEEDLYTAIRSSDVVEAGLVKQDVLLGGYVTAEEAAISAMLDDFRDLQSVVKAYDTPFTPKCIYVCETNIADDEQRPFPQRNAPPIRIWRYLVETCQIDPATIAVYCSLNVSPLQPLPKEFVLFRGGENDYAKFAAGDYTHIIFNLSLQEGWDDPACYLAYIDKRMGSPVQVEQIIGRVLRQPNAVHYPDARLNTCAFYIHVDAEGIFRDIWHQVRQKLSQDMPAVNVAVTGGPAKHIVNYPPRELLPLPNIGTVSETARVAIDDALAAIGDYTTGSDGIAEGRYARVTQPIGQQGDASDLEWMAGGYGMPVTVEWLLRRYIERQYPAAYGAYKSDTPRLQQRIQLGSVAAKQIEKIAYEVVQAYLKHTDLSVMPGSSKAVGSVQVDTTNQESFPNALHQAYSGLNEDEKACAWAIDRLGWPWCRNPSKSGFFLPLLKPGNKRGFFPDFIVWTDSTIWLIDPKGGHLLKEAAGKKLIAIDTLPGQRAVKVCLITQGKWESTSSCVPAPPGTVTAWRLRGGVTDRPQDFSDIDALLRAIVGKTTTVET